MLGNLGLHLERFPSGKYGYVGSIPASICKPKLADWNDTLANRPSFKGDDGMHYIWKPPVFDTAKEAYDHAINNGATLCRSDTCACAKVRKEATKGRHACPDETATIVDGKWICHCPK